MSLSTRMAGRYCLRQGCLILDADCRYVHCLKLFVQDIARYLGPEQYLGHRAEERAAPGLGASGYDRNSGMFLE